MNEIWKPIKDFEGLYEISNLGKVKSLCAVRWKREMIRNLAKDKDGYLTVNLKKNGKYYCKKVHRLVAEAFIPNPTSMPQVNHIDEDRANNLISNLEWCDAKYNNNFNSKPTKYYKAVCKLNEAGELLCTYKSVNEAAAANNL